MVVRPSASFYPSCPEYLIHFYIVSITFSLTFYSYRVNFDLVDTGKKLTTERAHKVAKNEAAKSASATTSASKAEHGMSLVNVKVSIKYILNFIYR